MPPSLSPSSPWLGMSNISHSRKLSNPVNKEHPEPHQKVLYGTVLKNCTFKSIFLAWEQDQLNVNILRDFRGMTLEVEQAGRQELTTQAPQSSEGYRMSKDGSQLEAEVKYLKEKAFQLISTAYS